MSLEKKYQKAWNKYLPVIRMRLKASAETEQTLNLDAIDFDSAGDRGKSGYTFNLEMENGKATNNISGSAVARDLYEILTTDERAKPLLQGRNVKISLGKSMVLSIKTKHISKFK
ncbi:hypothetical protein [Mucilaginibacter pedocola]|uniref:Uncharacterized protein n=1 Tax=Mucilaginibacter pedocola TaxID=1792845 RepID=A0A1S9PJA3_9SPHI|nr:hypothetical protein [Mucilaginibacter pedocola]OOQ61026.1 hypothetical protein BC343_21480 [Mucilaginibacter pedocola]